MDVRKAASERGSRGLGAVVLRLLERSGQASRKWISSGVKSRSVRKLRLVRFTAMLLIPLVPCLEMGDRPMEDRTA